MMLTDMDGPRGLGTSEDCFIDVFVSAVDRERANVCWVSAFYPYTLPC